MNNFVNYFQIYLLIMVRIFAVLAIAPMFSSNIIPNTIKMSLAFITTAVMFPMVANTYVQAAPTVVEYIISIVNEALIGIFIGFLMSILFVAFQVMSSFFEVQMGFSISETIDPLTQASVAVMGQFQSLIAILIFFAIDGQHLVIRTIYYSFKVLPVLSEASKTVFTSGLQGVYERVIYYMSSLFSVALSLALPVIFTLFLLTISLGLLAKAAPQMNVLMLGFPMQISLGMITYFLLTPILIKNFAFILQTMFSDISTLINFLGTRAL